MMFAKLKKKIEHDGGVVPTVVDSPGKSSGRRDSVSSLPRAGSIQNLGASPPGSVTSDVASLQDVSSARDEMALLLQRKSEQCKKLEGNISDLAALIKDKSKTIEKLELTLKQQEEVTNRRLLEQKEEFEAQRDRQKEEFEKYRDKLIEGYQADRIQLDKEKNELQAKLTAAEEYRTRYFKKAEETDEFAGLTTQELAKVKHLLLNTEENLASCRSDLEVKTRQCQAAETQVERLTDELLPLRHKLTAIETELSRLKEENSERAELVTSLSRDKDVFDRRLDEVNTELTEKQNLVFKLQSQLADLDDQYKTLVRNSDLQRNKTSKLVQEKDDKIDSLLELIQNLEQRMQDSRLSGDDRLGAFSQERVGLEQKLSETRQQLSEVKSTWSDKITQLEEQIAHLNAKIVEDSEELTANQKMADQMRDNFSKQVEDLKDKVADAEARALENLVLASSKETHYEKQMEEMKRTFLEEKLKSEEKEEFLNGKIRCLEEEAKNLMDLTVSQEAEISSKMNRLEEQAKVRAELEAVISSLKVEAATMRETVSGRDDEIKRLQQQIQELVASSDDQTDQISSLSQQLDFLRSENEEGRKVRQDLNGRLQLLGEEIKGLSNEKTELLMQIQLLKSSSADSRIELQRMVDLKNNTIEAMRKSEAALRQRLEALENTIELQAMSKAESSLYSDRIDHMTTTISCLQTQLADRNRTVKKQDQMLKDLRQTIQREFKLQPSSNDEVLDLSGNGSFSSDSPVMSRKFGSDPRIFPKSQELQQQCFQEQYSSHSSLSVSPVGLSLNSNSQASATSTSPSVASNSLLSTSSTAPGGSAADSATSHSANVRRDLSKDINFLYLKHVVLKFMLSRESEAMQLIKALSVLLNFSPQEQQLIRQTLEWKMSWFGNRPRLSKGQSPKVVPPTL